MPTGRRIPRDKAAAALTALLETICVGGRHADCVTGVYMFGSFARGALVVGDVDVDIEYDAKLDDAVERELVDNLVTGRDWNTPFRKALKPARALQVMFNKLEMVAAPVLVYQRGDRLADAVARVEAITPDPAAGRAERDPAHPAVEPVAEDLARPSRILLSELAAADLLADRVRRPCRCRRRGHRGRRVPQARAAALDASLEPARPIRSCRWPPPRGPGGRSAHASC